MISLSSPSFETKISPMMEQWKKCKQQAKDALLFFRLGDFYEAFHEDALLISKELDLTLTHRQQIPMCGVPYHTSELYVDRLIAKGYKVAIAEQTEDPKTAKGLVKREIVRILSPGTMVDSSLLQEKTNNFFVCLVQIGTLFGLCAIDLSTAEIRLFEVEGKKELADAFYRLRPSELLLSQKFREQQGPFLTELSYTIPFTLSTKEDWYFDYRFAFQALTTHYKVQSLEGFGVHGMNAGIIAAGTLLAYLKDELHLNLSHIQTLQTESSSTYMSLDGSCMKHLELVDFPGDRGKKMTLLGLIDKTKTPMGGRLLRYWIQRPLLSPRDIQQRQLGIEEILQTPELFSSLESHLSKIRDLDRLMMKVLHNYITPRDLVSLRLSLEHIAPIKALLLRCKAQLLLEGCSHLKELSLLIDHIRNALVDAPPLRLSDGNLFRQGYSAELDELRGLCTDSKTWIAAYQNTLREKTQIRTLKVGYTRAFGYFIEVSKSNMDKIPPEFHRRQTLVNGERFITEELKNFEQKALSAEERIKSLEISLFEDLKKEIALLAGEIQLISKVIGHVDCLFALAKCAKEYQFHKPLVDESPILHIQKGRHPVIEASLPANKFIPNDTFLDGKEQQLFLITGPNMSGKSTYIRQVALIVILAQIGSFVPADFAHIGIVDKVFTRIGASDDLSRGQSTFMVEMTETAHILHNATSRSLVILDEIGRGTSTYDGISIAWAVAEHLLTTPGKKAKTLFATHYWELTQLEKELPGAINYTVAVEEQAEKIVFLRRIVKGGCDKSYGIHVARIAGLPLEVIAKAEEVLAQLEKNSQRKGQKTAKKQEEQLSLFPEFHGL